MNFCQITFSPTGGTKKAADALMQSCCAHRREIDLCESGADFSQFRFSREDLCVVAVPSYGGRVPGPAVRRLSRMRGNGAMAVLVCVYGNRAYEDTLLELKDTLTAAGFHCIAAVAAVAQHSIVPQFAAGRPDARDMSQLREFGEKIFTAAQAGGRRELSLPGTRPYREYAGTPFKPRGGGECTRCGACAKSCPVRAIPMEDPSGVDESACISCMRCIGVCPSHAREVSPAALEAVAQKMKKACSQRKENELFL